jgi:ABC-type lipoprotein release transport system permease subunit
LLSILFGAMAAAALAHVLVTAIRRRRRDLAILKTLGFVQRQVRSAVAWQASAVALLAVVAGIPAGVVLGRWGWRLVASEFGVVPVSVDPILTLALVLPAALILANIVAAIPGRVAARTKPALVLRTE